MFTVVSGVLLKPLPFVDPQRLASLHELAEKYGSEWAFSYLNYLDCKRESRSFTAVEAWRYNSGTISAPGDVEFVRDREISSGLLSTLVIPLVRGRSFLPEEDRPGAAPVVIINERLWRSRFNRRPGAIGSRLVFGTSSYTIVGIVPDGFRLSSDADIFTPLGQND